MGTLYEWKIGDLPAELGLSKSKIYKTLQDAGIERQQFVSAQDIVRAFCLPETANVAKLREQIRELETRLHLIIPVISVERARKLIQADANRFNRVFKKHITDADAAQRFNDTISIAGRLLETAIHRESKLIGTFMADLALKPVKIPDRASTDDRALFDRNAAAAELGLSSESIQEYLQEDWEYSLLEIIERVYGWLPSLRRDKVLLETALIRLRTDINRKTVVRIVVFGEASKSAFSPIRGLYRLLPESVVNNLVRDLEKADDERIEEIKKAKEDFESTYCGSCLNSLWIHLKQRALTIG